jgi:hypothetical protein
MLIPRAFLWLRCRQWLWLELLVVVVVGNVGEVVVGKFEMAVVQWW